MQLKLLSTFNLRKKNEIATKVFYDNTLVERKYLCSKVGEKRGVVPGYYWSNKNTKLTIFSNKNGVPTTENPLDPPRNCISHRITDLILHIMILQLRKLSLLILIILNSLLFAIFTKIQPVNMSVIIVNYA